MKNLSFPLFKTKAEGEARAFKLEDPAERRKYFDSKAGAEIEQLRSYLAHNTFIGILLGKKNSGKGTYSKLFAEAVGPEYTRHISVGDIVRSVQRAFVEGDEKKKAELTQFLERRYRGFVPFMQGIEGLMNWSVTTLLPTELILTLVEYEISLSPRKALFIDGFPRDVDQIAYALFLRAIMGYREDPDFFIFIDVPEAVIDERLKYRVICPACQSPRNVR
ncbi:MAG: nucleoside monophosphate kinase, partial [bacterium]|nr:nucleoside monophosphate kinase [bacterium]